MASKKKQPQAESFLVQGRPQLDRLANDHNVSDSAFDKRIKPLQESLQRIQQAYLGSRERAIIVLEGWDTAGKGGLVRDPASYVAVQTRIEEACTDNGLVLVDYFASPITGGDGNREFFVYAHS